MATQDYSQGYDGYNVPETQSYRHDANFPGMKILIASDIHLGYLEKDVQRCDDSFNSFEEVLQLAVQNDVDLILLGGDLFHDANPSTSCYDKCVKLLRQYCLGDRPIQIEFLSNQAENFASSLTKTVNYEDPNLNVSMPLFTIHGNHDDFSGFGNMSPLDLLSDTGLINYFGRWSDLNNVRISPIILQKNQTKLAIYGLSYIHDNRLVRLFKDGKINIERPEDVKDFFNIFVIHQNRNDRGIKNYIPEDALPSFADIVVWGHEHDCRIDPEKNLRKNFYVSQPGSTVATSLSAGEALPKHCGILFINQKDFKLEKIPLKTVRPFIFRHLDVALEFENEDLDSLKMKDKLQARANEIVEEMLKEANELRTGHVKQPNLPLIRLRIGVTDECQMFNIIRFGDNFLERIANKNEIILYQRHFKKKEVPKLEKDGLDEAYDKNSAECHINKVEDVVTQYFRDNNKHLQILSIDALSEFTRLVVEGGAPDDKCKKIIDFYINEALNHLESATDEDYQEKLVDFAEKDEDRFDRLLKALDTAAPIVPNQPRGIIDDDDSRSGSNSRVDSNDEDYNPLDPSRRSSRGATVASTKAAPKGKKAAEKPAPKAAAKQSVGRPKSAKQPTLEIKLTQSTRTGGRASSRQTQGVVYIDSSDDD